MKKKVIIGAVIVGLVAGGWWGYTNWKEAPAPIIRTRLIDLDGDGDLELILVYYGEGDTSEMKAVDLEKGKTLWKAEVSHYYPRSAFPGSRIVRGGRVLVFGALVITDLSGGLYALEAAGGRTAWEYWLPEGRRLGVMHWLMAAGDRIVVFSEDGDHGDLQLYISAISCDDGNLLWDSSIPVRYIHNLWVNEDHLVIEGDKQLLLVDLSNGAISSHSSRHSWLLPDSQRVFFEDRTYLYRLIPGSSPEPLLPAPPEHFGSGMTEDSFIMMSWEENRQIIRSAPLSPSGRTYEYSFPPGHSIFDIKYTSLVFTTPTQSAFYDLEARYIPIVVEVEGTGEGEGAYLCIFDLEEGRLTWRSETIDVKTLPMDLEDIRRHHDHFLIRVTVGTDGEGRSDESALLGFDGSTGEFSAAVRILDGDDEFIKKRRIGNPALEGGFFHYGPSNKAIVVEIPDCRMVYASHRSLRLIDGRDRVESVFGPLPWRKP